MRLRVFTPIAVAGAEGHGARSPPAPLGLSARATRQASTRFVRSSRQPASDRRESTRLNEAASSAAFDLDLVVIGRGLLHRTVARLAHGLRQRHAEPGRLSEVAGPQAVGGIVRRVEPARAQGVLTMALTLCPSSAAAPMPPAVDRPEHRPGGNPRRLEPGPQGLHRPPDCDNALVVFAAGGLGAPEPQGEDWQFAARRLIRARKDRRTLDEIFDP